MVDDEDERVYEGNDEGETCVISSERDEGDNGERPIHLLQMCMPLFRDRSLYWMRPEFPCPALLLSRLI